MLEWIRYLVRAPGKLGIWFLVALVRVYQVFISPSLGSRCRFTPSCSSYAIGALKKDGFLKGSVKATWRLLRCNPFGKGGYDPP
ncbi:MAG: membrane protein insertion efficiency factor YidD [Deltaproteobacteria bacterium]|nr:membrane protein insertion efficiency factor YidD [Deltaproteobacteria bacterium]